MLKTNPLEGNARAPPGRRRQSDGVRRVGDLGRHPGQGHHLFHIDKGLTNFPVIEPQHVQRNIEAGQQQDRGRHVADPHPARHNLHPGQDGHPGQTNIQDYRLNSIQQ